MADSRYWRRPGRRDEERASFNRLVQRLERVWLSVKRIKEFLQATAFRRVWTCHLMTTQTRASVSVTHEHHRFCQN